MTAIPITPEVEQRFWARVAKGDGCWTWQMRSSKTGYGFLQIAGRPHLVHRIAYTIANGPIPTGMNVLHRCNNKACVRPEHLYAGTQADNQADHQARYPDPRRGYVCLSEAARQLGITRDTLRQQLMRRRLAGRKYMEWYISERELERYRRESLGRRGRPKHPAPR